MRILLINQTFHPDNLATSQQVSDLALFLKKKGHFVSVLTAQRGYEERQKKFPKEEMWQGIRITRVSSTGFGKGRFRYRIIDSLTFFLALMGRLIFYPRQDIVISFTSPPLVGVLGSLFCLFRGGRSVQWLMDINPGSAFAVGLLKRDSLLGRFLNGVFEFTLKRADLIVVLDRWMRQNTVSHGADPRKVVIVPPWAVFKKDTENLSAEIHAFKRQHGLEGKFVVLYSGNHSVVHPLDTLLEAAKILKDEKEIVFLFIGAGLRTKDVADFKKKHALSNIVQLPLQPRAKVKASFGSADLHAVVMGEKMSGLVHTSKIYSVLASGKPFVFIGPKESHVSDLIAETGLGQALVHGEARAVVEAIGKTQSLTNEQKIEAYEKSLIWVKQFEPETLLERVHRRVILDVSFPHELNSYSKKESLLLSPDYHWERTDSLGESTA